MKKRKTVIASLAILGVLFITAGVSYAFFSYSREGTKTNTITTGALTFHYEEDSQGITITDGMPMPDNNGKAQTNYFAFNISSTTGSEAKIPYEITVRRKGNDNSLDGAVKLYLTEVNNNTETALELATGNEVSKFSQLSTYTNAGLNIDASKNEKLLYQGEVPAGSNNYSKDYRLRMWLSNTAGDITYNQTITGSCSDSTYTTKTECQEAHEDWTDVATSNQKEFSIIVNVYATGSQAVQPVAPTSPVEIVTGDGTNVGDIVAVGTEQFYVLSNDGETATLLSRYNLNVGTNPKGTATGLQDSDVKGYVSSGTKYGNVAFSGTNYWSATTSTYPANIYDATKNDASGNNYSVAYYVNNYKDELEDLGLTVNTARLITYEELTSPSIGCNSDCRGAPSWIYETSYWAGSARTARYVWFVDSSAVFNGLDYNSDNYFGVRPVIEISSSLIQAS